MWKVVCSLPLSAISHEKSTLLFSVCQTYCFLSPPQLLLWSWRSTSSMRSRENWKVIRHTCLVIWSGASAPIIKVSYEWTGVGFHHWLEQVRAQPFDHHPTVLYAPPKLSVPDTFSPFEGWPQFFIVWKLLFVYTSLNSNHNQTLYINHYSIMSPGINLIFYCFGHRRWWK